MGYSSAEKKVSYIGRVNKFSTRPFRRGNNEHLALQAHDVQYSAASVAREMVQVVNDLQRRDALKIKKQKVLEKLSPIRKKLEETLKWDEYVRLKELRVELGGQISQIDAELSTIKIPDCAPRRSQQELLFAIVKRLLPKDDWREIVDALQQAMDEAGIIIPD